MSIIREQQIKQIRGEENRIKKIVLDYGKSSIKDYIENIKPVEILDSRIVEENENKINRFIKFINQVYLRLRLLENSYDDFMGTFTNTKGNEYRKFIEIINIVEPFMMWDDLMDEYTNITTNNTTREKLKINLQKITPYIDEIIKFLNININHLCNIQLYKEREIGVNELLMSVYKNYKSTDYDYYVKLEEAEKLEKITPTTILKELIESLAFYKVVHEQIERNNLNKIGKEEIAYEITQIINGLSVDYGSDKLEKMLIGLFKGTLLPELAPYFRTGMDSFNKRFEELEAMEHGDDDDTSSMGTHHTFARVAAMPAMPATALLSGEEERKDEGGEDERKGSEDEEDGGIFATIARRRRGDLLGRSEAERQARIANIMRQAGEGKGRRRKTKEKMEKQTGPQMEFDDAKNDPYYHSESDSD